MKRALALAAFLCLLASVPVAASVFMLRGSLTVPSTGTITDKNASSGELVTTTTGGTYQYGAPGSNLTLSGATLSVNASPSFSSVAATGTITAGAHNACSSSSNIPCETTVTCSLSAATTCTANATVPASSTCTATPNSSDTTTGTETYKMGALSVNTQPIIVTVSSQTSTAAFNVTCN